MSSRTPKTVAVLMGGLGAERAVSLSTGQECATALRQVGYRVVEIDAGADLVADLQRVQPDVVFNALHGRWGEDGCVQGVLEWMQIPYTHSGVLSSALAMDKEKTKEVFRAEGLPVVESLLIARADLGKTHPMALPYVIKPNNEGSSVGVYLVEESALSPPPLSDDMPDVVMVEAFAPGRELTTTVLGARALTVTDILTDRWYDYDAKYAEGGSQHIVPANLPQDIFSACLDYALKAHEVLGCRGISRTDFRWDEGRGLDGLVLLETNTQPGMTPTSLSPEQAEAMGISFPDLCKFLVEDASCNR
ncbi:D-alanine--D-alanine ligase [Planktomarina temperata]|nr:D-alanine--D-alanine ligase [Planktomarina temperata]MDB2468414.1 D-alanine--D-alanine ligase [Planktomarina temperata]